MGENAAFGMPKGSKFMKFVMDCLRENFPLHKETMYKTGPRFLTEVFQQYVYNTNIKLIHWKYTVRESDVSIIVDQPLDADWSDKENILIGQKFCRNQDNPGN